MCYLSGKSGVSNGGEFVIPAGVCHLSQTVQLAAPWLGRRSELGEHVGLAPKIYSFSLFP